MESGDLFQIRKKEIQAKLKIREIDWTTEKTQANVLWSDGFRLIVPLYWKEIVFHPNYILSFLVGPIIALSVMFYFITHYWHGTLLGVLAYLIYIAYYYITFYWNVEKFIKNGGVYPENAEYLKFFVATLDDEIIGCIGLTDGEQLIKPKTTDTQPQSDESEQSTSSTEKIASVWRLTVAEPYRRYSIGKTLMLFCEDYLLKLGYTKITLLAGNIDSLRFYDRLKYYKTKLSWEKGYHQSWFYALNLPRQGPTLLETSSNEKKTD